jgi:pyridoxine kinase
VCSKDSDSSSGELLTPACRLLSDTPIHDLESLAAAVQALHKTYQVPHVIITSLRLTHDNQTIPSRAASRPASQPASGTQTPSEAAEHLTIIGSTATSDHKPRLFRIDTPQLPLFFSGTGDMFAALTVPRLIEAVSAASTPELDLSTQPSWRSPDDVPADELPLAKACQKVLASMQATLAQTAEQCHEKMQAYDAQAEREGRGQGDEARLDAEHKRHLALMEASEVKVVRFVEELTHPPHIERFTPQAVKSHDVTE